MAVTSHDVARLAGVSQPTVSRALRGDNRVSEATRAKVRQAAQDLGYVANEVGRSLSTRSTRQIAMVTDIDNPLYPSLVAPLHDTFASFGYRMVLLVERGDDMATYDRLFDRSVDGAVLTTPLLRSSLAVRLQQQGVPFVQLNRSSDVVEADYVIADNRHGGAEVARLFLSLGHTRIGGILGPEQASSSRSREVGFREVLERQAVSTSLVRPGSFTYEAGRSGFGELMDRPDPPTAIFCANDIVAVGALNAAIERGIRVPEDVTIVGFDGLDLGAWPAFDLTSVKVDIESMARRAAEILVQRLSGDSRPPIQETFPVEVMLRSTHVARPPTASRALKRQG